MNYPQTPTPTIDNKKIHPNVVQAIIEGKFARGVNQMMYRWSPDDTTGLYLARLQRLLDSNKLSQEGIDSAARRIIQDRQIQKIFPENTANQLEICKAVLMDVLFEGKIDSVDMLTPFFRYPGSLGDEIDTIRRYLPYGNSYDYDLSILADYLRPKIVELFTKFITDLKNIDKTIILPSSISTDFNYKKDSIIRFLQSSKEELEDMQNNLLALTRRPVVLIHRFNRLIREYEYIRSEQTEVRSTIVTFVKNEKRKKINGNTKYHQAVALNSQGDTEETLPAILTNIQIRLDIIRTRLQKGVLSRLIHRSPVSSHQELEQIAEKLHIILSRYPQHQSLIQQLLNQIDNMGGIVSAKLQHDSAERVSTVIGAEKNKGNLTREKQEISQSNKDFITYLDFLFRNGLDHSLSSTKAKGKANSSIGDGTFIKEVLSPFLRSIHQLLTQNTIDCSSSISWNIIITALETSSDDRDQNRSAFRKILGNNNDMQSWQDNIEQLIRAIESFSTKNEFKSERNAGKKPLSKVTGFLTDNPPPSR